MKKFPDYSSGFCKNIIDHNILYLVDHKSLLLLHFTSIFTCTMTKDIFPQFMLLQQ